jgi:hypothetical protein
VPRRRQLLLGLAALLCVLSFVYGVTRPDNGALRGEGGSSGGSTSMPTTGAGPERRDDSNPSRDEKPLQVWSYASDDLSDWHEVQSARRQQVEVVDEPVRPGYSHSARFRAGPRDHTSGVTTTIRGEVRSTIGEAGTPAEGETQWYAWSTYFPEDFEWDGEDQFLIYTQWHQTANHGPPNIALWVTDGRKPHLKMTVRGGKLGRDDEVEHSSKLDLGRLVKGRWLDHTVRITWSSDPDRGSVTVWVNGEKMAEATEATLYHGQSAYLKQGIYAANNTEDEHTIYFSDVLRGATRDSVGLPSADG